MFEKSGVKYRLMITSPDCIITYLCFNYKGYNNNYRLKPVKAISDTLLYENPTQTSDFTDASVHYS